jgi:hypothetical protein
MCVVVIGAGLLSIGVSVNLKVSARSPRGRGAVPADGSATPAS